MMLLLLSGCGIKSHSYNPDESSIFLSKDGTIMSALVQEIDTKAKSEDLENFANTEVEDFNSLNAQNQVKLASLILSFSDIYTSFTSTKERT